MPRRPSQFLPATEQVNKVPRIIGYNDSEGLGILSHPAIKGFNDGISQDYAARLGQIFLEQNWKVLLKLLHIVSKIKSIYF